ncbi:hypothetical protein ID866_4534 [Astraeus odoratus]|nr:hypothetical protein ID866_4534 [Astraeus odoratus]
MELPDPFRLSPLNDVLLDWPYYDALPAPCRLPPPFLRDKSNYLSHPPSSLLPCLPPLVFPSSPSTSDTSSSICTADISASVSPEPIYGPDAIRISVCDVPVLAPRPLPYHSPTFLQFDLPDTDEDLSHPPYTHRPAKRKRCDDDDQGHSTQHSLPPPPPAKRRAHINAWRSRVHREQQQALLHSSQQQHPRSHVPESDHASLLAPLVPLHRSSGLSFSADHSLVARRHHP